MDDKSLLDFLEQHGFSVACNWKNTGFAGGPEWTVFQYGVAGKQSHDGKTLREAIANARESLDGNQQP